MNDHNLMNDHNKSFYPLDMFEFIHHPEYGCHDLKGLNLLTVVCQNFEKFFRKCWSDLITPFTLRMLLTMAANQEDKLFSISLLVGPSY
jgi:hypothetical protein